MQAKAAKDGARAARMTPGAEAFYEEVLVELNRSKLPFLVAGTFALNSYTGLDRPTKDIDFFCKPSDYPKILAHFSERGYKTEVTDERWLAKVKKGRYLVDLIFNSSSAVTPISDSWFQHAPTATIYKQKALLLPPTELIWSKLFIADRHRYDGSDIAHLILKKGDEVDWKRLLDYVGQYWEVLLMQVINFRFVYPTEREKIPRWLLDELIERLETQVNTPVSIEKVCRGRLFSREDYLKDIYEWGFGDVVGKPGEKS
jgi:hypothetical protein